MLHRLLLCLFTVLCIGLMDDTSAQTSSRAEGLSPKLAKLAAEIAQDDQTALARFWAAAEQRGPMMEELSDRPSDALYTFLWRASSNDSTFAVRLLASFTQRVRRAPERLKQLANTDVWYGSYALPKKAAIGYAFVVPTSANSSASLIGIEEHDGVKYGQYRDPLNPKTIAAIGAVISLVEGPSATSSSFLAEAPNVAKGSIASIEIESSILGGKRRVDVYTPAGYAASTESYPLVLMFDGDEYQRSIPTPLILNNMIARRAIPPVVVAFFHSPDRDRDLLPGRSFQNFLALELMPHLRKNFRVSHDPRKNVVAGYSLGGLAAVYSGLKNPTLFGNIISQSGSLWWGPQYWDAPEFVAGQFLNSNSGELIKTFAESPRLPIRFYLEAGEWEEAASLLPSRLLASVLKGKGYEVSYSEYLGAHDSYSWKQTHPDALRYVLTRP